MAINPCPCGYYGDPAHECSRSPSMVSRYQMRIGGPLLDRQPVRNHGRHPRGSPSRRGAPRTARANVKLTDDRLGEPSAAVRERVEAARAIQRERFAGSALVCNADMGPAEVREFCQLGGGGKWLLRAAMTQLSMSARAFHRILKLSRTVADLEGTPDIRTRHLAEAIQCRPRRQIRFGVSGANPAGNESVSSWGQLW